MTMTESQHGIGDVEHDRNAAGGSRHHRHHEDRRHPLIAKQGVDAILANPSAVATSARIVPTTQNGKPIGLKVYAIRPGKLWARLGLKNGDLVRAINGTALSSPDNALEVYSSLRTASALTIDITRGGKSVVLNYTIK
jgi:general secretion pathway protein C